MHLVCNNPVLYVVAYPDLGVLEVIDKRVGRGALMRDDTARRFEAELQSIAHSETPEDFDALIGQFGDLFSQPVVYH